LPSKWLNFVEVTTQLPLKTDIMITNEELQKNVQDAIKWQPLLKAAEIGVIAKEGVVSLTGNVNSFTKKMEAEKAAKSVAGVRAVVEDIHVKFANDLEKTDEELASEILRGMKWDWSVPEDKIQVKVEDGWVSLDGAVEWNFQRESAKNCTANLIGVKGVTNNISVKSGSTDQVEKEAIEKALSRSWMVDDQNIQVKVKGNKVVLRGAVESLFEKDEATRLAWNAPGVNEVDNELAVIYDF
jgi:osmotically-inducible protein OsmY